MYDVQRLVDLLNDSLHFAGSGKTAKTKIGRSEDAVQRIIPQLRRADPHAISNLDELEAYFWAVIRAAEASELFQKGRQAKQMQTRKRNFANALDAIQKRRTTNADFAMTDARDPISGHVITRELILAESQRDNSVATVMTAEVVEDFPEEDAGEIDAEELLKRDHTLNGGILFGLDGYVIEIQARAVEVLRKPTPWRSATKITGMAGGAIREVVDRISGAFAKLQIPLPEVAIMINLAPADLSKEGTWLDLPLAVIMLQASGYLPDLPDHIEGDFILMGEVGLHAEIRRVPGALSLAYVAKPGQSLIVPTGNERECALIMAKPGHEGCRVCPVSTLDEVIEFFRGERKLENALKQKITFDSAVEKAVDFGRIRGQDRAKEAALIAAAGGHNMLLVGPPGEGKSLLASAIPGILPRLGNDEKVQLTRIYSACGELEQDGMAVTRRPMRSIHHTASKQALIGGGSKVPRPGEITLSHLGVLFLDEIAEFSRSTLEALRQPMESGEVRISRVGASLSYPCRFTLVAAMNPCPCGYFGTDRCTCREADVKKYQKKISGPILDRIDLQVDVERLSTEQRFADLEDDVSRELRKRVERARQLQRDRFAERGTPYNAAIPGGHVREFCEFSATGFEHFRKTIDAENLSTRSMDRLAKVARTVADLADSSTVEPKHIDKAASFVVGGMLRDAK